jgi:hypothetical protein
MAGVIAHTLLRDLSPPLYSQLSGSLSRHLEITPYGVNPRSPKPDTSLVWMRDYHPLFVREPDGRIKQVEFASPNPARDSYDDSVYVPMPPPGPGEQYFRVPGQVQGRWLAVERVPLVHENGNLLSSGRHVFVTEHLLEENSVSYSGHPPAGGAYHPRSRDEVLDLLAKATDTARQDIVVLPRMPGEGTGHVDMFLLALGPDRVMIPEIRDEAIGLVGDPREQALGREVQTFLNERAKQLSAMSYQVERLPMMPPVYLESAPPGSEVSPTPGPDHLDGTFYSPTNSLLVDARETQDPSTPHRQVLVPTWDPVGFPEAYRTLNTQYQNDWLGFFEREGWHPNAVDATSLLHAHGLFRCLTYPVPA